MIIPVVVNQYQYHFLLQKQSIKWNGFTEMIELPEMVPSVTYKRDKEVYKFYFFTRREEVKISAKKNIAFRWFTVDEIVCFRNVSSELVSVLSEDLHRFRNGLHSPT